MSVLYHWDRLTREEIAELASQALVVVPVGSTEQHGPHLATGTDAFLASAVAEEAALAASRPEAIIVTPSLAFGASGHHLPFGATLSLGAETLQLVLRDLLGSIKAAGFHRVFLLNGHGGNASVCETAVSEYGRQLGMVVGTALLSSLIDRTVFDGPVRGHAGVFETSMMLALGGHAHMDRARTSPGGAALTRRPGVVVFDPGRWAELDGFTDDPSLASAGAGEVAFASCVAGAAEALQELAGIGEGR